MEIPLIIFFSSWKFALTFPGAAISGLSFTEIIIYTNTGGILGVYFFAYASKLLISAYRKFFPQRKTKRKIFSRRKRRILRIKQKYGLPGIVILNPILLSIPVSSFLVTRYYKQVKLKYMYLIIGQIGWSFIYTSFFLYVIPK